MINKILNLFLKKQNKLYTESEIKSSVLKNRESLRKIDSWVDENAFEKSYFNYGVPDYIKQVIDLEIGSEVTYSDIILCLSKYFKRVEYLELGVSVGKNLFQMMEGFENSVISGFDIENINPILSQKMQYVSQAQFPCKEDSIRTEDATITYYKYLTNSICYIASDIWDENTWSHFNGRKFNIIFSDALHNQEALLWEHKMIEKYNLLADEFLIIWDDLNGGLEDSFYGISEKLKKKYSLKSHNIKIFKTNGWVGENEIKHDVGIITNLRIR